MKYVNKSFAVGASPTKAYRDNWDRIFAAEPETVCKFCRDPECEFVPGTHEAEKHGPDTEPRVVRAEDRLDLNCSYCRPHKGENIGRQPKHGAKKPKPKPKTGRGKRAKP